MIGKKRAKEIVESGIDWVDVWELLDKFNTSDKKSSVNKTMTLSQSHRILSNTKKMYSGKVPQHPSRGVRDGKTSEKLAAINIIRDFG